MTLTGNWSYPNAIRFGAGRISEIGEVCRTAGITRPLLVTDRGLASLEITSGHLTFWRKPDWVGRSSPKSIQIQAI